MATNELIRCSRTSNLVRLTHNFNGVLFLVKTPTKKSKDKTTPRSSFSVLPFLHPNLCGFSASGRRRSHPLWSETLTPVSPSPSLSHGATTSGLCFVHPHFALLRASPRRRSLCFFPIVASVPIPISSICTSYASPRSRPTHRHPFAGTNLGYRSSQPRREGRAFFSRSRGWTASGSGWLPGLHANSIEKDGTGEFVKGGALASFFSMTL